MSQTKMRKLNKEEIAFVYENIMLSAFPDKERKPLAMILKDVDKGVYECLGLFVDEKPIGLSTFFRFGNNYLFDYLAVSEEHRNEGLGTIILEHVREYLKDAENVIGEVENPDLAKNEEDRKLQKRRLNFYLRNGYEDTGATAWLFGVDYKILRLANGKSFDRESMEQLYMEIYRSMLPKIMFKTMVRITK